MSLDLRNLRTAEIVDGVRDMRLDFGIVRSNAGPEPLRRARLGCLEYALFAPEALVNRQKEHDLKSLLNRLPLASLNEAGEFTRQFETAVASLRTKPTIRLQCASLTQAFRAVQTGHYAAVLSTLAREAAEASGIQVLGGKVFAPMRRDINLVWSPRAERIRPIVATLADAMAKAWRL